MDIVCIAVLPFFFSLNSFGIPSTCLYLLNPTSLSVTLLAVVLNCSKVHQHLPLIALVVERILSLYLKTLSNHLVSIVHLRSFVYFSYFDRRHH